MVEVLLMVGWDDFLQVEQEKTYFKELLQFVSAQRSLGKVIYPPQNNCNGYQDLAPKTNQRRY